MEYHFTKKYKVKSLLFLLAILFVLSFIAFNLNANIQWIGWIVVSAAAIKFSLILIYLFTAYYNIDDHGINAVNCRAGLIESLPWSEVSKITTRKFKGEITAINIFKKGRKAGVMALTEGLENYKEAFDFILSKGREFGFWKEG